MSWAGAAIGMAKQVEGGTKRHNQNRKLSDWISETRAICPLYYPEFFCENSASLTIHKCQAALNDTIAICGEDYVCDYLGTDATFSLLFRSVPQCCDIFAEVSRKLSDIIVELKDTGVAAGDMVIQSQWRDIIDTILNDDSSKCQKAMMCTPTSMCKLNMDLLIVGLVDLVPGSVSGQNTRQVVDARCTSYETWGEYTSVEEDCQDPRLVSQNEVGASESSGGGDAAIIGGGVGGVLIIVTILLCSFLRKRRSSGSTSSLAKVKDSSSSVSVAQQRKVGEVTEESKREQTTLASVAPDTTGPTSGPTSMNIDPSASPNSSATAKTQRIQTKENEGQVQDNGSDDGSENIRNSIDPSLLVDSINLTFDRDEKGDRKSLGRGAFGNVLVANYFGTKCAAKEILPSALTRESTQRFLLELKLIGRLRHPNVVQCLGVVWEKDHRGILFELCKNGSLDTFIKGYPNLGILTWRKTRAAKKSMKLVIQESYANETSVAEKGSGRLSSMNHRHLLKGIGLKSAWAFEIARGMAFLHAQNPPILHRDLKCANILLSGDLNAKITDFGESRTLSGVDENSMTTVGTPYFMAPEVFSSEDVDRTYSTKVDIYSFGVMLFEIYNNCELKKAFQNKGGMIIMNRVSKGWRPNLKAVKEEDKELADVIERCWSQDFSKRPTFEELIAIFQAQGGQDD